MKAGILLLVLLFAAFPLWAGQEEPQSFVGLTLEQLIARLGVPQTVFVSRGAELWQDDVVFQYPLGNFYIHRNRVWQVSLRQVTVRDAQGIRLGDTRSAVLLALGEDVNDLGRHVVYRLPSALWPMALRVNFNEAGVVTAIFIYRSDY